MGREKGKILKITIVILSILLALSIISLGVLTFYHSRTALAADSAVITNSTITSDGEKETAGMSAAVQDTSVKTADGTADAGGADEAANDVSSAAASNGTGGISGAGQAESRTDIALYKRHAEDNEPFQTANMFPGDAELKNFCVKVYHKGDVVVRFHADIQAGSEKLAETLNCRIVLQSTGETLYDGLMRDMPDSLDHKLTADGSAESELYYEITAYLDTGVGNEYMDKELKADFRWWVEETENLDAAVKTGDMSLVRLWAGLLGLAALALILLWIVWKRRSKEVDDESGK